MSDEFEHVARLIESAGSVVALAGAGISVESGIPDFRSPGGLWTRFDPSIYATFESFMNNPTKFWEMAEELNPLLEGAEPNPAHMALVELERLGKCDVVITQNIDNLHQRAGSSDVLELHGTFHTGTCLKCGTRLTYEEIKQAAAGRVVPVCKSCGGSIKPDVVLFGEPLNAAVLQRAVELATECDLMIVVGSGLEVFPAASLPNYAKRGNAKLVFINIAATVSDDIADVIIVEKAGEALPRIVEAYRNLSGAGAEANRRSEYNGIRP
ncbi:MAG: NAD-dependent deacylase [Actinobacteria bacterium]|nr:NAD-dependent deacylase [Actinomycetota bacterium]MBU4301948.1 NAD-dependent deacylase [Actinomycetota bacterium]MBU4385854.1 NAD-dependent deacylase [Actinomycetota bacterium]MBU4489812.1 NAD-dependent deacylase [Actinomycetota bacterium]MCG2796232.1 NAD-dependent deacylase [Actinomycetes bacterium]